MNVIVIILIIDAVISAILSIANVVIKKDTDRIISECVHELYENNKET